MPNLQERLRQAMRYTRLDADRELLNEAADEIDRRSGTHPAEVTRDEVMQAAKEATAPEWQDVVDGWHMGLDLMAFARAILALRPVQVPMTMKQIEDMALQEQFLLICDGLDELTIIVEAIEAHHGITVKVKNEAL